MAPTAERKDRDVGEIRFRVADAPSGGGGGQPGGGAEDDIVPVETSDALAELLPGLVTYHRVEAAQHLESWNLGPAEYEQLLAQFLSGL